MERSGPGSDSRIGNALPLSEIPLGTNVHNVELKIGKGGQMIRTAGSSAQRARGATSSVSVSPRARRSAPAQAIIAPLSVQSSGGGATSTVPCSCATRPSARRID